MLVALTLLGVYICIFVKYMFLARIKGKRNGPKEVTIWANKLDTTEDPQNNHTIEDLTSSWATPVKKCLSAMF